MKNNTFFLEEPITKLLFKFSIPAIIGMMVSALYSVVDRIFIGNIPHVGAAAIAGIGVTLPFTTIIMAFTMLLGIGSAANISIKLGQGKKESAEKIIGNTLTLSFILSIILTILGIIFCDDILLAFGASNESLLYAKKYMIIILWGTIFNLTGAAINNTLRTDGSPRLSASIMIASCFLNIILDPLFIFVFKMGIEGAAYATVFSQVLTFILSVGYYISKFSNMKLKKKYLSLEYDICKLITLIGISPFVMQLINSLIQIINNNLLSHFGGDYAIGAMAAINGISMLCLMPIYGITQGAQPIIGFNYGAQRFDRVKETVFKSGTLAIVMLTLAYIIVQLFPYYIIKAFSDNENILKVGVRGLRIYTFFFPCIAVGMIGSQFFQAIGRAKISLLLGLMRQAIILIPVTFMLIPFVKIDGVWAAQSISDFITSIVVVFAVKREFKKFPLIEGE